MKHTRGFTLIEMLIAISIIAVIATISTLVYRTGLRSYPENFEKANIQSNLNFVSDSIGNQIKSATRVKQSYPGGPDRQSNTVKSVLILEVPAIDSTDPDNPKFIYTNPGGVLATDTVIYYLSSGNLVKEYYGNALGNKSTQNGTPKTVISNVSNFTCEYQNIIDTEYSTVSCSITVTKDIFGKTFTTTSTKTANLRNL